MSEKQIIKLYEETTCDEDTMDFCCSKHNYEAINDIPDNDKLYRQIIEYLQSECEKSSCASETLHEFWYEVFDGTNLANLYHRDTECPYPDWYSCRHATCSFKEAERIMAQPYHSECVCGDDDDEFDETIYNQTHVNGICPKPYIYDDDESKNERLSSIGCY
ncbi:hypothetical protein [Clostridium sp.]|uniref:hypothetical protein n=1 Tax=Clostridium sp. TaxID=1506 RepID=UPI002843D31F|nr:hypothetical protein [Clostridium sp.]MDR3596102.1 hypothetical protein [Clostridium sp.]